MVGDRKAVKHHAIKLAKELCGWREESLLEVFTKLRGSLLRSKKARAYAEHRGLHVDLLEVGYNSGSYEDLKNCLVFPLKNELGEIVSFYGRSIEEKGRARHFYQRGRSGLYPASPGLDTERLILTEGEINAARLMLDGVLSAGDSVLAMYGAKVLSEDQELAIRRLKKLKEAVLYFDGDEAGRSGAAKWNAYLSKLLNNF